MARRVRVPVSVLHEALVLPLEIQQHLGQLLAAAYAHIDDGAQAAADRFTDLLAKLDATELARGRDEIDFRADLLAGTPGLLRFALSLTREPSAADDLVQNTLLRAWKSQDSFTPGTNLNAWLFTIMRNNFYTQHRKHDREVSDTDGEHAARLVTLPAQEDRLNLQDVQTALGRLSPTMREALTLVAIENLSYDEAAAVMNCQTGTVKSRVWRARSHLAHLLGYSSAELGSDKITLSAMGELQ